MLKRGASPVFSLIVCLLTLACNDATMSGGTPGTGTGPVTLRLEQVVSGLSQPLHLTAPAGDDRLFIVEKTGRIRIVRNGQALSTPFLNLSARVSGSSEQGLLSMAFHPQYATNGLFFVNFTDLAGDTRVERFQVSSNRDVADPASSKLILTVDQPYDNHNGGHIVFGPDGKLYIAMGDGGSGGDPLGHGQNRATLLGDLLRIDVDAGDPYAIPPDNPFVGQSGMRGEIWAWGLRNPWRIAFDRQGGRLYIADVGQGAWEEVNVAPTPQGGINYGWKVMEGSHCFSPSSGCNQQGLTLPAVEYGHSDGCSITGGLVYRGTRIPEITGHYFYGDLCRGWIGSFRYDVTAGMATDLKRWTDFPVVSNLSSFGEDGAGELYVLSLGGTVYRIARAT